MAIARKTKKPGKMSALDIENALGKDHYLVAAYDSQEDWNQKILVVIPELDGPTWVLRPMARTVNRINILALAVPSINDLTLELAQDLTHMGTDYITVRQFPEAARRSASKDAGDLVNMPWNR